MVAQDHEHQILVVELLQERGHCIAPTSIGCHFDPIAAGATAMTEAADHHSCRYYSCRNVFDCPKYCQ